MTGDVLRHPAGEATASQAVAAAIAGALQRAGTRLVFGVPGGGPNLDVVGAAADAGLRFVLAHGETSAAIMAATCADLTGSPGAVVVTRGPGLASAVNGIAHSSLDRLPLVVVADTVPARDRARISHQRLDQDALGRSVAKAAVTADGGDPERAAELAVRLALAQPAGPVVVNVDPDGTSEPIGAPAPGPEADGLAKTDGLADVHENARAVLGEALGTALRSSSWGLVPCGTRRPCAPRSPAAESRSCTPTGRGASCLTAPRTRPGCSPAARWSRRCWPPPI
jgi:thiamine pyrophosphate-dependent acetolactate synthase large subunit-like protein